MSNQWTRKRVNDMIVYRSKSRRTPEITRERIYKYLLEEESMIMKVYGKKLDEKRTYSPPWVDAMDTFIRKITIVRHLQEVFAPPKQEELFPPDEIKSESSQTGYDI